MPLPGATRRRRGLWASTCPCSTPLLFRLERDALAASSRRLDQRSKERLADARAPAVLPYVDRRPGGPSSACGDPLALDRVRFGRSSVPRCWRLGLQPGLQLGGVRCTGSNRAHDPPALTCTNRTQEHSVYGREAFSSEPDSAALAPLLGASTCRSSLRAGRGEEPDGGRTSSSPPWRSAGSPWTVHGGSRNQVGAYPRCPEGARRCRRAPPSPRPGQPWRAVMRLQQLAQLLHGRTKYVGRS